MKRLLLHLLITLCAAGLVRADQTIRSLQQTLKDQGFYYGRITGEKSAETTAAIRRYQIRSGLQVTGEINPETSQSLSSNSNSVVATARSNAKPAAQANSVRPDASASRSQTSQLLTRQPERELQSSPPYSATFYQSLPVRVNRRMVAGAQYQLMTRGYYRGRIDGRYGRRTAFALRAFQSSAGLPMTGRLDMQTLDALGLSDTSLAYVVPDSRQYEAWIPVRKFKHGKWKVKWKKYHRPRSGEPMEEDQQANREYVGNGYDQ